MTTDAELLSAYAAHGDESAFTELVRRHLTLVYFAALRRTGGNAPLAEEIAQCVFTAAARKAGSLARHATVVGWLYTTTRNVATDAMRRERTRLNREREAQQMHDVVATEPAADWEQLRPVIDAALDELGERDREAVLLRFFQGQSFAAIGATLRISEDAARMRVDRALEKIRGCLGARGFTSTAAALGVVMGGQSALAAPTGLAASVVGAVLTGTTGVGAGSAGLLIVMSTTKFIVTGVAILGLGGIGLAIFQVGETQRTTDALAATVRERDTARAESAALEKRTRIAEQENATARERIAALENQLAAPKPNAVTATRAAFVPPSNLASTRPPADDAAVQQEKAKLHRRYDPLLQQRGFTAEQAARFVELMRLKNQVREDVQAAVEQQGARGDDPGVQALRAKLDGPIWREIREMLGPDGMAVFGDYEQTSAYRLGFIDPIRPVFAAANAALTADQEDRLVRIILANTSYQRAKQTDLGTQRQFNWDAISTQADTVLTAAQKPMFELHLNRWKSAIK